VYAFGDRWDRKAGITCLAVKDINAFDEGIILSISIFMQFRNCLIWMQRIYFAGAKIKWCTSAQWKGSDMKLKLT